ncbi:hypothetical protein BKA70DRAFT_1400720 [Coprinopsis sp. MPI-PUGE-AT-0042]|nr:hypothetical protein BKA70DRAFT_1400720 [Coprinopsis sp. MPI-PUGE-AT-0042]
MVSTTPDVLAAQAAPSSSTTTSSAPPQPTTTTTATTNGTTTKKDSHGIAGRVGGLLRSKSKKDASAPVDAKQAHDPSQQQQSDASPEVPLYKRYASSAVKIIRSRSRSRKERDATGSSSVGGESEVPPVPLPKDGVEVAKAEDAAPVAPPTPAKEDKPLEPVENNAVGEAKETPAPAPVPSETKPEQDAVVESAPSPTAKLVRRLSDAGQALVQKVSNSGSKPPAEESSETKLEVDATKDVTPSATGTTSTSTAAPVAAAVGSSTGTAAPAPPPPPPVSKGSILARQVSAKAEDLFPLPRRKSVGSSSSSFKGKEKERTSNDIDTGKVSVEGNNAPDAVAPPPASEAISSTINQDGAQASTSTTANATANPEWVLVKDKEDPDVDKPLPHPPTLTRRISQKVGGMLKAKEGSESAKAKEGDAMKVKDAKDDHEVAPSAAPVASTAETATPTVPDDATGGTRPTLTSRISSKVGAFIKADMKSPLSPSGGGEVKLPEAASAPEAPTANAEDGAAKVEIDAANVPLPPDDEPTPAVPAVASSTLSTNASANATAPLPPVSFPRSSASDTQKTQKLGRRLSARVGDLFKGGLIGRKGKGPEVPPKEKVESAGEGKDVVAKEEGAKQEEHDAEQEKVDNADDEEEKVKAGQAVIPPVDGLSPSADNNEVAPAPIPLPTQDEATPTLAIEPDAIVTSSAPLHVPEEPKSQSPPLDALVDEVTPPDAALAGALQASGVNAHEEGNVPLVIPPVDSSDLKPTLIPTADEKTAPVDDGGEAPPPVDKDGPVLVDEKDAEQEAKTQSPPLDALVDEVTPPDAALADALKSSGVAPLPPVPALEASASPPPVNASPLPPTPAVEAPRPAATTTQTAAPPTSFGKTSIKAKKLGRRLSARVGDLFKRDNKSAAGAADTKPVTVSGVDGAGVGTSAGAPVGAAFVPEAVPAPAAAPAVENAAKVEEKKDVEAVEEKKVKDVEAAKAEEEVNGLEEPTKDGEVKVPQPLTSSESTEAIENVEQLPPIPPAASPEANVPVSVAATDDDETPALTKADKGKEKEIVDATLASPTADAEHTSPTSAEKTLPEKPLPTKPSKSSSSSKALLNVGRQMSIRATELLKPKPRLDGAPSESGQGKRKSRADSGRRKGKGKEEAKEAAVVKEDKTKEEEGKEEGWEQVKRDEVSKPAEDVVVAPVVDAQTSELKETTSTNNEPKKPVEAPEGDKMVTTTGSHPPASNAAAPSSFARPRKTSELGKRLSRSMGDVFKFDGLKGKMGGSGFGPKKKPEGGVEDKVKDESTPAAPVKDEGGAKQEETEVVKDESPVVPPKDEEAVVKPTAATEEVKTKPADDQVEWVEVAKSPVAAAEAASSSPVVDDAAQASHVPETKADGDLKPDGGEQKKRKTKLSLNFKAPKFGFMKKEKTVDEKEDKASDVKKDVKESKVEGVVATEEAPAVPVKEQVAGGDVPVVPEKDEPVKVTDADHGDVPTPAKDEDKPIEAEKEEKVLPDVAPEASAKDVVVEDQDEDVKEEEPEILAASRAVSAKAIEVVTPVPKKGSDEKYDEEDVIPQGPAVAADETAEQTKSPSS